MSKFTLNFFGDTVTIPKPKDLPSLRRLISLKFFLSSQDAEEILLTYINKGRKITITTEEDLKSFISSKINKINLEISEKSQIFKENFNKIQKKRNFLLMKYVLKISRKKLRN